MTTAVLDQLENAGLLSGARVNVARVEQLDQDHIAQLGAESAAISSAAELPRSTSPFSPIASLSLGGARAVCWYGKCREARANELAQYAALYADQVYIYNFLVDHSPATHLLASADVAESRFGLIDDVTVIATLRPLIEAGRVVLISPPERYCSHCLATLSFGSDADKRFDRAYRHLERRFLDEVDATADIRHGQFGILFRGPPELMDHGTGVVTHRRMPKAIAARPGIMARLKRGERVELSRTLRKELDVHGGLARLAFSDITFELAVAQCLGAPFLTDRPLHIDILSQISANPLQADRNRLVQEHLRSLLPFVTDVPIPELLKLREREEGAFIAYRQSLDTAMKSVLSSGRDLTARDAQTLYNDVIAPALAKLDLAVSKAKRDLVRRSALSVGAWGAVLAFGTYTGLLADGIAAAAKALGLGKAAADVLQNVGEAHAAESAIRNQDMYYLWKVRQLATRHAT